MDQENINNGRDQNIFNQPGTVNVDSSINFQDSTSLPKLRRLEPNEHLINYFLTLLSLTWYLATWILLGLIAKSEFPIDYVWKLVVACLKGSDEFSSALNTEQHKIYQLKEIALKARRNSKEENSRLNKLDSKIIILESIIKRLYKRIETKEESISRILRQLENKRRIIQVDLEPLRQYYDPQLYKLERVFQTLLEGKNAAEKDYERLDNILKELIEKYGVELNSPSSDSVSNLIQELRQIIYRNPKSIRYSRLATLKRTLDLLQWTFSLRNSSYSPEFISLSIDEEDFSDSKSDENTLSDDEDIIFDIKAHYDDLDEFNDFPNIDLEEVIDKPQGEFINQSWLKSINALIEKAIKATTETSKESINNIKTGIEKEWINRVSIYGFDRQTNLVKVELALEIDWNNQEFSFYQETRSPVVSLDRIISEFQEFSEHEEIIADWRVHYTHPENIDFYNQELGFVRANPVTWATYGEVFKASALGHSKLFIELNFGPSKHPSFGQPRSVDVIDTNPKHVYVAALFAAGIMLLGLWSLNQKPEDLFPQSPSNVVLSPQERIYWEQLHISVSVWDIQTAQRHLSLLSQSQNSCISGFSKALEASLNNRGELGFKDINQIKRAFNEMRECNFVITPYEFAP